MKRVLLAGTLLALAGAGLAGCFSERNAVTGPGDDGEGCNVPGSAIGNNRALVLVRNFRFLPDTVRIRAGGTVTWVNCETEDIEPHTSTSTTDAWDSGPIAPGTSFARTFPAAGTFSFFCRPHPSMRGAVVVS
jgi:plastocyanin